jgi:hypothetical protein
LKSELIQKYNECITYTLTQLHIIYTVTAFLLCPPLVDAVSKEFGRLPACLPASQLASFNYTTDLLTYRTYCVHIRIVFPFCCIPYRALSCQGMQTIRNIFKKTLLARLMSL